MRIGIITAMAQETKPLYQKLGNIEAESTISGVRIVKIGLAEHTVYLATGGVGEIRSAMTAQLLKDLFDVEAIVNFGFVGALNPALTVGELVIAKKVCHYQFDTSALDGTKVGQYDGKTDEFFRLDGNLINRVLAAAKRPLRLVTVASGDVFVASAAEKKRLAADFGCDICEMELAALAIVCELNRLPLLSVKVVSDRADGSAAEAFRDVVTKGVTRYEELLPSILAAVTDEKISIPPVKSR